jgi:hypothetical protein
MRRVFLYAAGALVLPLMGCQTDSSVQQQKLALTLAPESLAQRQAQMRRFDTKDENNIIGASAAVLQDLGFTIEESSAKTGLIVASKDRDAVESGQVAGQIFLAALITAMGGRADPVWERNQKIRISIVTRPSADSAAVVVRVTFQRVIWNTKNQVSRVETLDDVILYQQFFDRLAQSVFLEAHQI